MCLARNVMHATAAAEQVRRHGSVLRMLMSSVNGGVFGPVVRHYHTGSRFHRPCHTLLQKFRIQAWPTFRSRRRDLSWAV